MCEKKKKLAGETNQKSKTVQTDHDICEHHEKVQIFSQYQDFDQEA